MNENLDYDVWKLIYIVQVILDKIMNVYFEMGKHYQIILGTMIYHIIIEAIAKILFNQSKFWPAWKCSDHHIVSTKQSLAKMIDCNHYHT